MNILQYRFDDITKKTYNYFIQYTNGRKLSDILHHHDFYEIIFVLEGACVQQINGNEYSMRCGDFTILRPGDSHVFLYQSDNTNIIGLSVRTSEFDAFISAFGEEIKKHLLTEDTIVPISSDTKITGIYKIPDNEYEYKFLLCCFINQYITSITPKNYIPCELSYVLKEMKKTENLCRGIDAMLEISHYSRTQLSRLIKKYLGITLHDYLLSERLNAAYSKIIFTSERIEDISEEIGYASFSHFNQIFKEHFGITAAKLRQSYNIKTI